MAQAAHRVLRVLAGLAAQVENGQEQAADLAAQVVTVEQAALAQEDLRTAEIPVRVVLAVRASVRPERPVLTTNMARKAAVEEAIKAPGEKKVATGTNGRPTAALAQTRMSIIVSAIPRRGGISTRRAETGAIRRAAHLEEADKAVRLEKRQTEARFPVQATGAEAGEATVTVPVLPDKLASWP